MSTYYAESYQKWCADVQRQVAVQAAGKTLKGKLVCLVDIIIQKPKTTKLLTPRGDVDNYVKGCLDGVTKTGLWDDDTQVEVLISSKRWTQPGESPGAAIHIGEIET